MRVGAILFVVAATAAAFLGRTLVVLVARRRRPTIAALADRWWTWIPLAAVCGLVIWSVPVVGIVLTIGLLLLLTRATAVGSPFRPRR